MISKEDKQWIIDQHTQGVRIVDFARKFKLSHQRMGAIIRRLIPLNKRHKIKELQKKQSIEKRQERYKKWLENNPDQKNKITERLKIYNQKIRKIIE